MLSCGALAGGASPAVDKEGWAAILVPADPLQATAVPSPGQLTYQTNQMGAFLHYGPAVFLDGDWKSVPDPKVFNPTRLDAEQWVRTAKSFDAKHLVLSSKHHNGSCLWPTKTTGYSVRSSPWKNGHGDVVREVAEACKKHGIALGLYYSGHDRHFPCHTLDPATLKNREAYWPVYRQQIEELLTNYGQIICLWLDGYGDPFSWDAIDPKTGKPYGDAIVTLAKARQPNIVIWHGTTPEKLMEQYYVSVGRGANFLNALVPDKRGLIDDAQAKSVAQFGAEVRRRFAQPLARTDSRKGWPEPGLLQLDLGGAKRIAHVVLEEEIAKGQHVLKYAVDAATGGTWKTVAEGQSIGRKRIDRFEPPITAEKIRLRILQANAIPSISTLLVYGR
jgi:alpha-L-fucosidase